MGLLDILQMPDDKRQLVNWILRRQSVSVAEASAHLRQDETSAQRMLDELVEPGPVAAHRTGSADDLPRTPCPA